MVGVHTSVLLRPVHPRSLSLT
jgi:alkylated DNA repair protein alkB family protein 6